MLECGNAMLKNGYKVRILNTINFKKSMHYNPFAYVHSEKDILKLVTTLMTNTKGEGSGGDPFWEKSERLLLTALIAYLHSQFCTERYPLLYCSNQIARKFVSLAARLPEGTRKNFEFFSFSNYSFSTIMESFLNLQ